MNKEILEQAVTECNKTWANSPSMQEYTRKKTTNAVKTKGGHFIVASKPHLETSFCFASADSYNRGHDEELSKWAYDMCDKARNDYSYFIAENTKEIDRQIKELEEALETSDKVQLFINYNSTKVCFWRTYTYLFRHDNYNLNKEVETLDNEDVQALINMYKEEPVLGGLSIDYSDFINIKNDGINALRTQFAILWGEITAATIVVVIPTLIIVLLFQKQIYSGLTAGAVKG